MVAHATITIYITVIEVSCMHLLLCAIYQNQKGVWLLFLLFCFNKFQYQTQIPNKQIEQNAFLTLYAPISQNGQTHSNNLSANSRGIV